MRESTLDSIIRLMRYQRSPLAITRKFREWKHNADILPKLQNQLEVILEAYGKFEPVVYDTQGIRDDGVDIALRYYPDGFSDQTKIIGFQAKSYDDLSDSNYLQGLKAQHDDAFRKVSGLSYYFILLCTDGKKHRDKIRQIAGEYKNANLTELIEPAFAYTFFHHPKTRIEALIKRTLGEGDLVLKRALKSLEMPSPAARALAVFLTVKYVLNGSRKYVIEELTSDFTLKATYEDLRNRQEEALDIANQVELECQIDRSEGDDTSYDDEDDEEKPIQLADFEQQLAQDIELLEGDLLEMDSGSHNIVLRTDELRPLVAVVADALARYEHNDNELMSYMFSVMCIGE
jgi:hypothetical protein